MPTVSWDPALQEGIAFTAEISRTICHSFTLQMVRTLAKGRLYGANLVFSMQV